MTQHAATVVGGGVAGCAAAMAAARCGVHVTLFEQRPTRDTPLHSDDMLCALTGGPDLGAAALDRATGLLKAELRELCPALLDAAGEARIGENSLSVDPVRFAHLVTRRIEADAAIEVVREEARALPRGIVVVATGPTTWSPLARALHSAAGAPFRFSFLGRAPVIAAADLDLSAARWAPLYPGADASLFVPISEDEAEELRVRLLAGQRVSPAEMAADTVLGDEADPVERRAADPKLFRDRVVGGPRGPEVTIEGPAVRLEPHAAGHETFGLPDLLTALTPEAQRQALDAIPALAAAQIVRPGSIHRLPWLAGAEALLPTLQLKRAPRALLAGTLTGAAGYVEAMATGTVAGINAARLVSADEPLVPGEHSLIGALCRALVGPPPSDERMIQANYGMLPDEREDEGRPKRERRERQIAGALKAIGEYARAALDG